MGRTKKYISCEVENDRKHDGLWVMDMWCKTTRTNKELAIEHQEHLTEGSMHMGRMEDGYMDRRMQKNDHMQGNDLYTLKRYAIALRFDDPSFPASIMQLSLPVSHRRPKSTLPCSHSFFIPDSSASQYPCLRTGCSYIGAHANDLIPHTKKNSHASACIPANITWLKGGDGAASCR